LDTTRLTDDPITTDVPAPGFWLITFPEGTVALNCWVIVPTVNPAEVMVDCAVACTIPTTLGTVTVCGVSQNLFPVSVLPSKGYEYRIQLLFTTTPPTVVAPTDT
jgi:hypothetical protein